MKIQCPAKINLDLKITSKREDGFHNLESVMQTISLYDYLTLETSPSEKFEINLSGTSDEIPYNEKNLVHKAILLFVETTNLPPHKIEVFIEKNIPVSAGLAGGSTNAAEVSQIFHTLFTFINYLILLICPLECVKSSFVDYCYTRQIIKINAGIKLYIITYTYIYYKLLLVISQGLYNHK